MNQGNKTRIGVYGAGSIGCYVGGRLASLQEDCHVTFVGRPKIQTTLAQHGLHLTDLDGADVSVPFERFDFATEPAALCDCDLILVCVKSAATETAGRDLAKHAKAGAVVLSLQNGIRNGDVLSKAAPQLTVISGLVEYNVVSMGNGHFHRGSEGVIESQAHGAIGPFVPLFTKAGAALETHQNFLEMQWAKLLLNLNNAVNALSGLPLLEELSDQNFRRCLADAQEEALYLLELEGITPAKITPVPPNWLPKLLRLPNWIYLRVAKRNLEIDPLARSSTWEDLEAGRQTEVQWINGEVTRLANNLGESAPVNQTLIDLIREAEKGGKRDFTGEELLSLLRS